MASMVSSSPKSNDDNFLITEIIFSCSICQATPSEVYATKESNHGFHSGSGNESGIVTKMWIAECSHVTCAKHLENSAAPFHTKGLPPKASCPKCLNDKDDGTPRELYGIRGLCEGEYDSTIPSTWMDSPPVKLDSAIAGMDAVRFQYVALVHFSRQARKHWKNVEHKLSTMEAAYSNERKQRRQVQSEALNLKRTIETLEKSLKQWKDREPAINHCVRLVPTMSKDIQSYRNQLVQLGFHVPQLNYAYETPRAAQIDDLPPIGRSRGEQHGRNTLGSISPVDRNHSHAVRNPTGGHTVPYANEGSSSARKRKREDYPADKFHQRNSQVQKPRSSSLDLMPPPRPRFKSPQRVIPTSARVNARQALRRPSASRQDVQIYEDRAWKLAQPDRVTQGRRVDLDASQAPIVSQFQYELPFRTPPMHSSHSRELVTQYQNRLHSGYAVTNSQQVGITATRPFQSFSHPNLPSPDRRQGLINASAANHRQNENNHMLPQERFPPITHNDSIYRTVAQQRRNQNRPPLQEFSGSDQNHQLPLLAQTPRPQDTRSPQETSRAPVASVVSPFFERGGPTRPLTEQHSTRGSFIQPPQATRTRGAASSYPMAPPSAAVRKGYTQRRLQKEPALTNQLYQTNSYHPTYQSSEYRPDTGGSHSLPLMIPQTPRNSQGLFQRPDRPPPLTWFNAPSRPQSGFHRGRVSLTPATGPSIPTALNQDHAVSQIRGVRGVSSQRVQPSLNLSTPNYNAPRNSFSSAGGRRSVQR